jgi:branched-chain amino acid transport system ATP-binding protein
VSAATAHALELIDVHAGYGRIEVLHGVTLAVPVGTVYALLGPNGGGKSTTLQVISGNIRPRSGCVHVAGAHVNGARPEALARAGVSRIPEGRGIFPNLTVDENLRIWTYAADVPLREVQDKTFTRFPRLAERRHQPAGTMSGGEQQMLAMSRALVADPAVLLLDEISMGLAPLIVARLYELVRQLAEEGITILLVEQFANTALGVADFAAVMTHGRIVAVGQPADIADHVSAAYLGGAA